MIFILGNIAAFFISLIATGIYFNTYIFGIISPDIEKLKEINWIVSPDNLFIHPEALLMSLFLHIGIVHLLINLIMLLYLTTLKIKTGKFMLIYFTSGIMGNLTAVLIEDTAVLGASGAILGVLGYSLWHQFKEVYMVILLTVIPGLFIPGISNGAHLGGLITGIVIGMMSKLKCETDQIGELRTKIEDKNTSVESRES
jgi:membrane associated rhomboid family serine protease